MLAHPSDLFPNQTNFDNVRDQVNILHQAFEHAETSDQRRQIMAQIRTLNDWLTLAKFSPCLRTMTSIQPRALNVEDFNAPYAHAKLEIIVDGVLKLRRCFKIGTDDVFVKIRTIRDKLILGSIDEYALGKLELGSALYKFIPKTPIQRFAVKNYLLEKFGSTQENMEHELTFQRRLTELDAPYILHLLQFVSIPDRYMAILPLIEHGDLFDHLDSISPSDVRPLLLSMLRGVHCLHSIGVCHRDISPENFLLKDKHTTLLMDFGLAAEMDEDWQIQHSGFVGKKSYAAPEVWVRDRPTYDGRKVDVWSLAVSVFVLLTKTFPWSDALPTNKTFLKRLGIMQEILNLNVASASPLLVDLLLQMFKLDPDDRPTVGQLLDHAYFAGM